MTSLEDYKAIAGENPGYLVFHFIKSFKSAWNKSFRTGFC